MTRKVVAGGWRGGGGLTSCHTPCGVYLRHTSIAWELGVVGGGGAWYKVSLWGIDCS